MPGGTDQSRDGREATPLATAVSPAGVLNADSEVDLHVGGLETSATLC